VSDDAPDAVRTFEEALDAAESQRYVLTLFVTGLTPRSTAACAALRALCDEHLRGRYELQVVDVYQQPHLAREEQIIALPTLVKKLPAPLRRLIGNLANEERVLTGLGLRRSS
jgi:circadian clock protein KaiB